MAGDLTKAMGRHAWPKGTTFGLHLLEEGATFLWVHAGNGWDFRGRIDGRTVEEVEQEAWELYRVHHDDLFQPADELTYATMIEEARERIEGAFRKTEIGRYDIRRVAAATAMVLAMSRDREPVKHAALEVRQEHLWALVERMAGVEAEAQTALRSLLELLKGESETGRNQCEGKGPGVGTIPLGKSEG